MANKKFSDYVVAGDNITLTYDNNADTVTIDAAGNVDSVNGQTGVVVLTKTDVGLANVTNVDTTNASNITSGTLSDSRLSTNVTTQGNTFNVANKLVQLDASAKLPSVDGSQLTNLPTPSTPTLSQVTSAGNTTTNAISVGGLTSVGNVTPSGAIARGSYFNNTLVAAANNDVLVGLDINPTFTIGSFTGVYRAALRVGTSNATNYVNADFGSIIIQSYSVNNNWYGENVYYNGSGFIYKATGYGSLNQFYNGQTLFTNFASKTAGSTASGTDFKTSLKADFNGNVGIGGNIDSTLNSFTGSLLFVKSNGNVLIGTTTDAGYKLDVNGGVRIIGNLLLGLTAATGNLSAGRIYSKVFREPDGDSTYLLVNWSGYTNNQISFGTPQTTALTLQAKSTGYVTIPNGNVGIGIVSPVANLQTAASITAATSIARGVYFNNTLVAAANNDVLVGLDINPTFTNGAFTGVSNIGLRVQDKVFIYRNSNSSADGSLYIQNISTTGSNNIQIGEDFSNNYMGFGWYPSGSSTFNSLTAKTGYLYVLSGASKLSFNTTTSSQPITFCTNNWNEQMRIFGNGNVIIGGGNAPTDAGYKLDVNGSTRIKGAGNTQATTAFIIQNSDNSQLFKITNDGATTIGAGNQGLSSHNATFSGYLISTGTNGNVFGTYTSFIASAIVQCDSTTRGFLPPRMTTTQKNAIATPAAGLVVYDTTLSKLCVYTSAWETITSI